MVATKPPSSSYYFRVLYSLIFKAENRSFSLTTNVSTDSICVAVAKILITLPAFLDCLNSRVQQC